MSMNTNPPRSALGGLECPAAGLHSVLCESSPLVSAAETVCGCSKCRQCACAELGTGTGTHKGTVGSVEFIFMLLFKQVLC